MKASLSPVLQMNWVEWPRKMPSMARKYSWLMIRLNSAIRILMYFALSGTLSVRPRRSSTASV